MNVKPGEAEAESSFAAAADAKRTFPFSLMMVPAYMWPEIGCARIGIVGLPFGSAQRTSADQVCVSVFDAVLSIKIIDS